MAEVYRLQALLELRKRHKEAAEQILAQKLKALKKAEKELEKLQKDLEEMIAERLRRKQEYSEQALRGEMQALQISQAEVFIQFMKEQEAAKRDEIIDQQDKVDACKEEHQKAQEALIKAEQALQALEKHRDKWLEAIKRDIEMKNEQIMDDLAQRIYRDQKKNS